MEKTFKESKGAVYLCHNSATGTGDVNSTLCCDNTTWTNATLIAECEKKNTKLGRFDLWKHEQIQSYAYSTMSSFLYVVVGTIQSNIAFYSLNSTTIHAAPYDTVDPSINADFDVAPSGIWYAGKNRDSSIEKTDFVTRMYLKKKDFVGKSLGDANDVNQVYQTSTRGQEDVWLVASNAFCDIVHNETSQNEIRIKINDNIFVHQDKFRETIVPQLTEKNCNGPHIVKFALPGNVYCNKLRVMKDMTACVSTLKLERVNKVSQFKQESNAIYIVQRAPKLFA